MSDVMLSLGEYVFGIDTAAYESLNRVTRWRWASQERLSRSPARQYLGPGDDSITLPGVVYPQYRGGLEQLENMRVESDKGEALLLVDSRGNVRGHWCIESVEETQSVFHRDGTPKRIDFNLTLIAYGDDDA